MATLTAPKNKIFKDKTVSVASAPEMSEDELWEKATAAMQEMALNATALADTASGLVQKLDAINARLDRKLKHPAGGLRPCVLRTIDIARVETRAEHERPQAPCRML